MEGVYSEDIEFATGVILTAKRFAFYGKPYYYYRIGREGSLANKVTLKHVVDLMDMLEISMNRVNSCDVYLKDIIRDKLSLQYTLSFVMIFDVDNNESEKAVDIIESKKKLYKNSRNSLFKKTILKLGALNGARILIFVRMIRRRFLNIH